MTPTTRALASLQLDVTEILRATSVSDAGVVAIVAGIVAGSAMLVGVALTARRPRALFDPARAGATTFAVVAVIAGAASVVELGVLVVDGAAATDRRPLVAVARLLVLAAALTLHRLPPDDPVVARARGPLGIAAWATVALGAPALGSALHVSVAFGVASVAMLVAGLLLMLLTRRVAAPAAAALTCLFLAVPAAFILAPDRVPPYHEERIVIDDVVLDVTVAPVQPGRNELHLYAWDGSGIPLAVATTSMELTGHLETREELFVVSPNHHLSYALMLPQADSWQLRLTVQVAEDGPAVTATLDLEAS